MAHAGSMVQSTKPLVPQLSHKAPYRHPYKQSGSIRSTLLLPKKMWNPLGENLTSPQSHNVTMTPSNRSQASQVPLHPPYPTISPYCLSDAYFPSLLPSLFPFLHPSPSLSVTWNPCWSFWSLSFISSWWYLFCSAPAAGGLSPPPVHSHDSSVPGGGKSNLPKLKLRIPPLRIPGPLSLFHPGPLLLSAIFKKVGPVKKRKKKQGEKYHLPVPHP